MDGKGDSGAFSLILERIGDLRTDQKATTEAIQNFGFRLTGLEERFLGQQVLCEERYGQRIERIAERVRELGSKVDGQEITHRTNRAALEAEHKAMQEAKEAARREQEAMEKRKVLNAKVAMWGAGVLITSAIAILGWLVFK